MATPPKIKDLVEELHDVKTKWRAIGIQLDVPPATLKRIDYSYKTDPEQAFTELILEWMSQLKPGASWAAIVDALRSRSVGETALASVLERKWCPVQTPPVPATANAAVQSTRVTHNATLPHLQTLPYKTKHGNNNLKIIERTAAQYLTLGIFLLNDVDGSAVKRIELENHFKPVATMTAIYHEWIGTQVDHTWKTLIRHLNDCRLGTLARELEDALKQNGIS